MASDSSVILEGSMKFRDGKKWKPRWGVLTRLSPVADCMQLLLYRDQKERLKEGYTKGCLSLQNFYGCESGFVLDKECNTLAMIIKEGVFVFAFDTRERLIQWQAKISLHLGEAVQFEVEITSAPPKSKCGIALGENSPRTTCSQAPSGHVTSQIGNGIGATLHLVNARFCLTSADSPPPKLLHQWEIANLRRFGVVDGHFCWEGGSSCGPKGLGVHVVATAQRNEIEEVFKLAAKGSLIQPGKRACSRKITSKHRVPGSPKSTAALSHGESKNSLLSSSVMASPSLGGPQMRRMTPASSCRCATVWSSTESGSSGECSHFASAVSRPDTPDSSTILSEKATRSIAGLSYGAPATPDPTTPKKKHAPHFRQGLKHGFSPSWKMDGVMGSVDSGHIGGSVATSSRSSDSEYCSGVALSGTPPTSSLAQEMQTPSENYDKPRSLSIPATNMADPSMGSDEPSFAVRGPNSKLPTSMSFCERCVHCCRPKMMHGMCCEPASQETSQQGNLRNRLGLIVPTRPQPAMAGHQQRPPLQQSFPGSAFPQQGGNFYPRPDFHQRNYPAPGHFLPRQHTLPERTAPAYRPRFYDVPRMLYQQRDLNLAQRHYLQQQQTNGWGRMQRPAVSGNGTHGPARFPAPRPTFPPRCPTVSAQAAARAAGCQQMQIYENLPDSAPTRHLAQAGHGTVGAGRCTGSAPPMGNYANLEFAETLDLYENVRRPVGAGEGPSAAPVLPPRAHPPLNAQQHQFQGQMEPQEKPCGSCPSCTREQKSIAVGDDYVFMAPLAAKQQMTAKVANGVDVPQQQVPSPSTPGMADQNKVCSPARSETADSNVDEIYVAAETKAAVPCSQDPLAEQADGVMVSAPGGADDIMCDLSYVCGFGTFPRMKRRHQQYLLRRSISLPGQDFVFTSAPEVEEDPSAFTRESSSSEDSGVSTASSHVHDGERKRVDSCPVTESEQDKTSPEVTISEEGSLSATAPAEKLSPASAEEVHFAKESAI